jgi:hypothetical protein
MELLHMKTRAGQKREEEGNNAEVSSVVIMLGV